MQFRIFLDVDFNPTNGNEIEIDQGLLPNTGTNVVALAPLDLQVNPATVAPGTYAICGQVIAGALTRYLYASDALVITPSLQQPAVDASSLARVGGTLRFNVLAFPGQNVTVLATTDLNQLGPGSDTHLHGNHLGICRCGRRQIPALRFYRAVLTPVIALGGGGDAKTSSLR